MSSIQLPPLPIQDGKLYVSPSQLEDMKRCVRYWGWRNLYKRVIDRTIGNRDASKAFHAALEAGPEGADAALAKGFAELTPAEGEEWRNEVRYREVLEKYHAHWKDNEPKTLAREWRFEQPLGTVHLLEGDTEGVVDVILRGVIDRIVQWPNGVIEPVDTKVKNEWRQNDQVAYERSQQMLLYCWVLEQDRQDKESTFGSKFGMPYGPLGFMLDVVIVREPFAEATKAKAAKSAAYAAKLKPREEFKRLRYDVKPEQLEETRRNALAWVQRAVEEHARGWFTHNLDACGWHYNKPCPYLDVCRLPEAQRLGWLKSDMYKDKSELDWTKEKGTK